MDLRFPLFEVPIIAPDLKQEETLIQIADTLDYLSKVTEIIFTSINNRIAENKRKVSCLQERAHKVKQKVDKLTGITKATQIFSTAKYPASEVHKDYISIFSNANKINFTSNFNKNISKTVCIEKQCLDEKLQFFHVKSGSNLSKEKINITSEEGLGNLPLKLETVSSLLLFNTCENPYKKYVTLDPMGVTNKTRKSINNEQSNQMEAAPISISQQLQLDTNIKENYFYCPSLGDVPNLDVPLDLPDLPGIADDLRYSSDLGPGFAPSVTMTPAIPDLPIIPGDTISDKSDLIKFVAESHQDVITTATNELPPISVSLLPSFSPPSPSFATASSAAPPPPPPPPPPPSPPPPPPPPPPISPSSPYQPLIETILEENKTETIKKEDKNLHSKTVESTDNARATLMAAIRNAGGVAKLRSMKKNENYLSKSNKKPLSSNDDFMDEFHNKLLMRRKGISGGRENVSISSAMDKISAMIPPPLQPDTVSTTEDDDWEE